MVRKMIGIMACLVFFIVTANCTSKAPESTGTQTPSGETIQPGESSPVPEPSDKDSPLSIPATSPPTEPLPAIDYENAIQHYGAGTAIEITRIGMTEATTGWAIGQKNGDSDHVLKTTDGGETWWDVTPPQPAPPPGEVLVSEAFFLNQSTAWVSFSPYEIVWRTTDAGITWMPARVPMAGNLGATLWFLDAETGWMMKYLDAGMNHVYSALFRTSSGGQYWEKVFDPYSDGGVQSFSKTGMVFADINTGWITRDPQGVQPGAFVDSTADGGFTWDEVDVPPPASEPEKFDQEFCGMFSPELFSSTSGALVVTCRRYDDSEKVTTHFLALTSDAGTTWTLYDYPGGDLRFINPNLAYALGRDIYKSTDGGKSWTKVKGVNWDGQFSFVNENLAWAVARAEDEIALVHTTDGGGTFSEIKPQVIDPPAAYQVSPPSTSSEIDPAAIGGGSKQIAFISYRDNTDPYVSDIYLMNIDGSELREITDSSGLITHFSWSPDGQRLVFDSDRDGDAEIYTIKIDGSDLTQLTSNSTYDLDPAWSPDGTQIAYIAYDSGSKTINLMNVDGSDSQFLVDGKTPAWSPNGSAIAFGRYEDGIYTIAVGSGKTTRLTDSSRHGEDFYPEWSPDGSLILFASNRHQPGDALTESVYIMKADGSGIGRLSEVWGSPPFSWSPDGQWIVYTQGFYSGAELYMMDSQGFNVRPLMEDNLGLHPQWRP